MLVLKNLFSLFQIKKEIKKYFYNDSFYKKIIKKKVKTKDLKLEFSKISKI